MTLPNQINFYLPGSTTPYPFFTGYMIDQRYYMELYLEDTSDDSKFISAQVVIGEQDVVSPPDVFDMALGNNYIINPEYSEAGDIQYANPDGTGKFVDNHVYTIKIRALLKDENDVSRYYFAKFGIAQENVYSFLYRDDGGDVFNYEQLAVLNEPSIEGIIGSDIILSCPMNFVNPNDTRTPTTISFAFEEVNMYESEVTQDSIIYYTIDLPYDASNIYTLPQTEYNQLYNDQAYYVNVTALYSDGFYMADWFPSILHVIEKPVINSVTAYGLASDQSNADDLAISSVMNVYMNPVSTSQDNLPSESGNITFELSQGGVVMYTAEMPVITEVNESNGTILYTILKENLVKVWTTTAPTQNSNGSYTYDVSAKIEHYSLEDRTVLKQSAAVTKTFTSDIVPINSVVTLNAWIAGSNVATADASGNRIVDISNATTASGYAAAPELGIVGKFSKTDFYGSGITDGFFKDLDTVNTKHKFIVRVNGNVLPFTELHQLQGHSNKTDQEMYIQLFESLANAESANKYTDANGSFPNLPGPASTAGSAQQPIYFLIPSTGLFAQADSVTVSIAIEPPAGETTRPSATESNNVIVVAKVNQYEMTVGTASEPKFSRGTLTIPINNPTSSEYYFTSAIFTSNLAAPNALKEVSVSNGGVFNIAAVNPNIRGANCDYQVRYKISDPNVENGFITGPISTTYSVLIQDEPGLDNFILTNFTYDTFNNNGVSKFQFDIAFVTVGTRSIDGVFVYFQSTNDDADASNDIPRTLLMDVKKSDGAIQTNVSYTLQNVAAASAILLDGVFIKDKDAVASFNKWLNFRSGEIVFKPYKLVPNSPVDIQDVETANTVFNIPVIPVPTNLTLTGGVKESQTATSAAWSDALSTYASIGSSVTASYNLLLNANDVSAQVANHGYTINLAPHAAGTELTLTLRNKLTAADGLVYLSKPAGIQFTVASVDVTGMTNNVKRGSNNTTLRVERGDYAITPASGANVTEVKLIDNPVVANTDPEAAQVKVLTCSSTADAVQPVGPAINEYDLVADGYVSGDVITMQYRLKAGVSYDVLSQYDNAGEPGSVAPEASTPLFLTLASPQLTYIVARKPEIEVGSTYIVDSGGIYNGRIGLNATINANGLHTEGIQSVVFVLAQEGDATHPTASEEGRQLVIAFESSNGLTKSYTIGPNASSSVNSTDNLGANEVHELSVTGLDGFVEGSATSHTLVMGNLLENDTSILYLAANSGFDANLPISVVAAVSTRLGTDLAFKEVTLSSLSNFSVPEKEDGNAPFALTAPTSSIPSAFTYTSSNPAVATISGSTVTVVGAGTSIIIATQNSNKIYTSLVVTPLVSLDGATIKYTGNAADVPTSSARFVKANIRGTDEWFAVIKDGMKSAIYTYANGGSSVPFTPPGQSAVPFNNIVTTLTTDFSNMFGGFFNEAIGSWDTSNVTNMKFMFHGNNYFNQPIGAWNTSNVTNMESMFKVTSFDQPIGSWKTSKVTDMNFMFAHTPFNQPINYNSVTNAWNTSNVTNMEYMFSAAASFNQAIGLWNTANTLYMAGMFIDTAAFNQDISGWNVALVEQFQNFRLNSALTVANMPAAFYPAASLSNFSVASKTFGDAPFILTAPSSNSSGAFTYVSSDETAATISGSTVTIVGAGTTTITAIQAATATYASNSISATLTVIGPNWNQRGLDIDGEASIDLSGWSVSISSDGSVVAIGATGNDGNDTDSGHVRVYAWNGTAWVQRGLDIDGEAADDNSGFSVSISSDGSVVAIGAYGNNGYNGHVRVYYYSSPSLSNFSVASKTVGDVPFTLTAPSSNSAGAFTYTSSDETVATISGSTVTIVGAGTTTITAIQAATNDYIAGKITASFVVNPEPE